jgi:hypothetical protein
VLQVLWRKAVKVRDMAMKSFPVEVSGWDLNQEFFVERTELEWVEDGEKHIVLRTPIKQSAVLFVRLVQIDQASSRFPVAYQAARVLPRNGPGWFYIELCPLQRAGDCH